MPVISGMERSNKINSGRNCCAFSMESAPFTASRQTLNEVCGSTNRRRRYRMLRWSSAQASLSDGQRSRGGAFPVRLTAHARVASKQNIWSITPVQIS